MAVQTWTFNGLDDPWIRRMSSVQCQRHEIDKNVRYEVDELSNEVYHVSFDTMVL